MWRRNESINQKNSPNRTSQNAKHLTEHLLAKPLRILTADYAKRKDSAKHTMQKKDR